MRLIDVGTDAVGIVAIGARATGVVAIGQTATGAIAIGEFARGGLCIGVVALGLVSISVAGLGVFRASGIVAVGARVGRALIAVPLVPAAGTTGRAGVTVAQLVGLVLAAAIFWRYAGVATGEALLGDNGVITAARATATPCAEADCE